MTRPLALAALLLALPLPLQAQAENARQCAPREALIALLADRYGESRQALGLAANNAVVEIFANPETGSWTITGTLPSGVSCLIASGEAWQALAESLIQGEGA
ncbi:hypothetical protein [Rhodovulum steppense]|uniref:YpeB-like protein with protease inhibitory function n=1 Tax=Rhodovulum steppense TaxID=540251 RepID=A0A4R1Z2Z6_9RHOB|nr:hypothetical protein [Rhodovulum steppense]TCM88025.1 hypothetical protein EV216_10135 [Rhodovulum steppense]